MSDLVPPATKIPVEAYEALDRVRADRAAKGLWGYVMLRVDDGPKGDPSWRVIVGETVVATSAPRKGP